MERERTLLSSTLAQYILFYTALWTVKLSILLFFRRLFGERQQAPWLKAWWCCASDTITEIMILSIPVIGLWNIQISFKKKLALLGILCLTVITILFAFIRITVMPNKTTTADITWLCFWAHVEAGVAVIVACLAPFRQLFVKSANPVPHKQSSYPASSTNFNLSRIKRLFSHVLKSSSKASSEVANILSPLRNRPRPAESLSSHKLVDGPAPFDTTPIEEDLGASNKLYFGGPTKLAQGVHTAV
nr:hypothetical protein [Cladonia uncialis subsp. uncialis]